MSFKGLYISLNRNGNKIPVRRNLGTVVSEVVLLCLSAIILSLAFPGPVFRNGVGFLALFALIPVFAVIRNTTFPATFFYGLLYGFVFYGVFNYWLSSFHPFANYIVQIIKGLEMALLFPALKVADSFLPKKLAPLAQAFIFVGYTYLSQSWFAGYPYGIIAYSLYKYTLLIQIADFSGIWLLNFLVVLPQAFIGQWCCRRFSKTKDFETISFSSFIKSNSVTVILFVFLLILQLLYGVFSIKKWKDAVPDKTLSISTVQHNVDSNWDGGLKEYAKNLHNLERLSIEAKQSNPDLIVWSETAFVSSIHWYKTYPYQGSADTYFGKEIKGREALVSELLDFAADLDVPLLTGNPHTEIADGYDKPYDYENEEWNRKDYNSAVLLGKNGVEQVYFKQHLVPFTEHFPFKDSLPHIYNLLLSFDYQWWEEGHESVVFTLGDGTKFSTPICFEDVFGYLCAEFVRNGADLLINLTNDSWSGSESAMLQHGTMAVFRAVENRKTVLRSTNNGYTCMITPWGKIAGDVECFTRTTENWTVPVYKTYTYGTTMYSRYSDSIALVLTAIGIAFIMTSITIGIVKKSRRK